MNIELRPITDDELPLVVHVQQQSYVSYLHEDIHAFRSKREMYPDGCMGAFVDGALAGYSISFPWFQDTDVVLHISALPTSKTFDCYYMHDVAVLSQYRGHSIADKLVNSCIDTARSLGLYTIRMVTVQGGENIWSRYGFEVYGTADESYGPNSFKMTITLDH
jgi:ribosomal protein S18 acetylase RimI-like enzyme